MYTANVPFGLGTAGLARGADSMSMGVNELSQRVMRKARTMRMDRTRIDGVDASIVVGGRMAGDCCGDEYA